MSNLPISIHKRSKIIHCWYIVRRRFVNVHLDMHVYKILI